MSSASVSSLRKAPLLEKTGEPFSSGVVSTPKPSESLTSADPVCALESPSYIITQTVKSTITSPFEMLIHAGHFKRIPLKC